MTNPYEYVFDVFDDFEKELIQVMFDVQQLNKVKIYQNDVNLTFVLLLNDND